LLPIIELAARFGINRRIAYKWIDHHDEAIPAAVMGPSRRLRDATPGGCWFNAAVGHPPATHWHPATPPSLQR